MSPEVARKVITIFRDFRPPDSSHSKQVELILSVAVSDTVARPGRYLLITCCPEEKREGRESCCSRPTDINRAKIGAVFFFRKTKYCRTVIWSGSPYAALLFPA